ncbi:glycosyltransferase family 4 protein [Enterovibrio norvegicus]|uniref:glycosyltransferase family 4 protein n=1 Tax=Enterovibrio norvegicus TaxID=188144 RepID=UPI00389B1647
MADKKTIWIINQYATTLDTGMGGRQYYFAKELAEKGHTVYLIGAGFHHLQHTHKDQKQLFEIEEVDGFNFVSVKSSPYSNAHSKKRVLGWFFFSFKLAFLKSKIPVEPDTIIVSTPSIISFLGAKFLSKRYKAKLVWDIRDLWPLTLTEIGGISRNNPFVRLLQFIEDLGCKGSDIVTSNWPLADKHLVTRGLEQHKFHWLPNGFSSSEFTESEALSDDVKNKIPVDKFLVAYTGTLGTANAIDVLLDVAEILKPLTDIGFLIAGGGKEQVEFEKELVNRQLTNVHYIGPQRKKQVPTVLSYADACYVGFKDSPIYRFGNSLNKFPEYLASSKPIIYSINSTYRPVDLAKCGYTVPAENPEKIAAAIIRLAEADLVDRNAMGENGKRYAFENFEYKVLADKLEQLL